MPHELKTLIYLYTKRLVNILYFIYSVSHE